MKGMIFMRTFGTDKEIRVGKEYELRELWEGEFGDVEDILKCGTVSPDEENVVAFEIVEEDNDPMFTTVKVTDIY